MQSIDRIYLFKLIVKANSVGCRYDITVVSYWVCKYRSGYNSPITKIRFNPKKRFFVQYSCISYNVSEKSIDESQRAKPFGKLDCFRKNSGTHSTFFISKHFVDLYISTSFLAVPSKVWRIFYNLTSALIEDWSFIVIVLGGYHDRYLKSDYCVWFIHYYLISQNWHFQIITKW